MINIITIINISKKTNTISIFSVVFAILLITSVIASSDNAFAKRNGHSTSHFNGIGS